MGNESHPKKKLRMLSLCAGIGGSDLAAEATGAIEVVGQVEINPFCQAVLAKHWPNVKRMNDIKEVKGHEFGAIDILVAGIPCQGNSLAGKRKGSQDERNLWPETKRIICKARPRWIVVENVVGLLSVDAGQLFATVLADLDTLGYRIGWSVYGACEVGAPHQRERVFLVAYSGFDRQWQREIQHQRRPKCETKTNTGDDGKKGFMAYSSCNAGQLQQSQRENIRNQSAIDGPARAAFSMAYANSERCEECNSTAGGSESRLAARCDDQADRPGQLESGICRSSDGIPSQLDEHRWPARPGEKQKENEPTRTITEKIPFHNKRLEALGNAIVPQQIYPLFNAIVNVEYMEYVA